jgi:hypothetical protein
MQNRCVVPIISKIIKTISAKKCLRGVSLQQHIDNESRVLPFTQSWAQSRETAFVFIASLNIGR